MTQARRGFKYRGLALAAMLLSPFAADQALAVSYCVPGPGDRPETLQGAVTFAERNAPGGFQGHWCGARKVAQHNLFNRGSFGDLQQIANCVYASMRDPSNLNALTTGTVVLDASVPSNLVIPPDASNPNGRILRTRAMIRAYSALERSGNIMVAAFKDLGPVVAGVQTNPLDVYDISDCLNPVALSTTYDTSGGNHDGWLTPDAKTYYGIPFSGPRILSGTAANPVLNPNRIDMHVTDLSDPTQPKHLMNWNRLSLPGSLADPNSPQARTLATTHFHDVSTNEAGTRVYMALYGGNNSLGGNNNNPIPAQNQRCSNGLLILDSSDVANRVANPQLKYISFLSWCDQQIDPDFGDGSTASAHATEYIRHQNGKEYVVTTDESSGGLAGNASGICAQRSYARFIDISDEANPKVVGTFKPDVNKPSNCASNLAADTDGGMVHYIGFDDRNNARLVIYAAANQGIRVVDIADPANPKEIAYYVKERHTTTAAGETDFTRPDVRHDAANCLIYTGWNQGGLVSFELTNPEYNPCMRRQGTGRGTIPDGSGGQVTFTVEVARTEGGYGNALAGALRVVDPSRNARISIGQLEFVGSVRDQCGSVPAMANSMQFSGKGLYNNQAASFRACIQDNGTSLPARIHVTCTAGCSYNYGGAVSSGTLKMVQR